MVMSPQAGTDRSGLVSLSSRQQSLAASLRCHYATPTGAPQADRPHCQRIAVVSYGAIALCAMCAAMASAVTRGFRRALPGAELSALIVAAGVLEQAEAQVAQAVAAARAAGASWSQVGDAVGVSRQGAQQRWGNVVSEHRGEPGAKEG